MNQQGLATKWIAEMRQNMSQNNSAQPTTPVLASPGFVGGKNLQRLPDGRVVSPGQSDVRGRMMRVDSEDPRTGLSVREIMRRSLMSHGK